MKPDNLNPAQIAFCEHYSTYGNAAQAYIHAHPKVKYSTARTEGPRQLQNQDIKEYVDYLVELNSNEFQQTKDKFILDTFKAAEQAKEAGQFMAYGKIREQIIKMLGWNEPDKVEHSGSLEFELKVPGLEDKEDQDGLEDEEGDQDTE